MGPETRRVRFREMRNCFAAGLVLSAIVLMGSQEKSSVPEDAKGQATLEKICAGCHGLDEVTAARRTKLGWQQNVEDMVSRGAEASEQDVAALVAYLTKFYGMLNVNTASQQQLQESLELTDKEAQAIVLYRDRNGKIKDFEQLVSVPGVSAEKLKAKRSLIAFAE